MYCMLLRINVVCTMIDDFGSTLLLYRTAHGGESFPGLEPMVKLLIDRGADVHVADDVSMVYNIIV